MALPCSATGLSAVYECGISGSLSLTFLGELSHFQFRKDTFLSLTLNLGGHAGLMSPISLRT